uniref:ATP-dependent Clp protease proteolytic subunit n=1 Tax=Paulinella chromatophora TaxID=39717 RepID=B1X4K7_PAUCH|nr:Clp protease proteolytic subunit [Paulinella chromatophora]ACB42876.1 Clp protease proteolytic subunit [Paulinella chromatophora]
MTKPQGHDLISNWSDEPPTFEKMQSLDSSNNYSPLLEQEYRESVKGLYSIPKNTEDRIILISEEMNDEDASDIIAQLLMLEAENPDEDIQVYINCMGGSMYGFVGIYDTMQAIKPDVVTLCYGSAFEMSGFLLSGGAKGKRLALPNARIMLNQPETSFYGCITDLQLYNKELMLMRKNICSLIAAHTGQRFEKVTADTNRDQFFSAAEAIEYGLIDRILNKSELI